MTKVTHGVDPHAVPTATAAALGFSYSVQVDDKRNIVLQSHVSLDCSPAELNAALDKMGNAVERQAARYTVIALRRSLAMQKKQLRRVTEDLVRQDEISHSAFRAAGKKGIFKLTEQQEVHRANVLVTQGRFKEEIEDIERELAAAQAIANGTNVGPNS